MNNGCNCITNQGEAMKDLIIRDTNTENPAEVRIIEEVKIHTPEITYPDIM